MLVWIKYDYNFPSYKYKTRWLEMKLKNKIKKIAEKKMTIEYYTTKLSYTFTKSVV